MWVGHWVEGERGAHVYNKIRITPRVFSFASGGNSDYFYFAPEKSKIWCHVKYEVVSRSQGDTYPDEDPLRQETARSLNRSYKVVLLKLEHSKCTGYRYLQMAFLSDLGDKYADIIEYDDKQSKVASFNYHRVDNDADKSEPMSPNPSINTDAGDKAARAGYVKR